MAYESRPMPTRPAALPSLRKGLPPLKSAGRTDVQPIKPVARFPRMGRGLGNQMRTPGAADPRTARQSARRGAIQYLSGGNVSNFEQLLLGRLRGGGRPQATPYLDEIVRALLQGF